MKISLAWLREFADVPADAQRLKADLTMIGLNVESLARAGDDWVLDVEVTTNRPDCLSHYGVAREAATFYRRSLRPLTVAVEECGTPATEAASIEIADPDLCARYCGRVIRNVQVKPSPEWLVKRLEAIGQRPINNVADVTNYVLMELGHPLHAFDLARLKERRIIVRRARPGEPLRTLDGVDHTLNPANLVIADGVRPVALAGVMGGEDSEISPTTTSVLLESAWFDPLSIRRTSKAHGMHTEASHRFERGADIEMSPRAADRAAELIRELAGGEILRGVIDVYPAPPQRQALALRPREVTRILGAEISTEEIERILRALGFDVAWQDAAGWRVAPPSWRLDVTREVDLIEEVARHFGYDRLPARVRPAPPRPERDTGREKERAISCLLVGAGYHETIAVPMLDPEENARFTDKPPVVLANPLSQDASALRSSPAPSMVQALRWNLDRDRSEARLFETGKVYTRAAGAAPSERRVLSLGVTGHRYPNSVHDSEDAKRQELSFFDLKGALEALLALFDIPEISFEAATCIYLEPGQCGRFAARGETVAIFGRLKSDLKREYKLRQEAWLAEVDLDRLLGFPLRVRSFRPFSKFPAVERDFSLLVPENVAYRQIAVALRGIAREELQDFRPMDLLPAGQIEPGQYSLLVRVTFQSSTHTLTSEEITAASQQIVEALAALGIRLRA
jgi:phenylalanyl-tRNA synthetase beta chain